MQRVLWCISVLFIAAEIFVVSYARHFTCHISFVPLNCPELPVRMCAEWNRQTSARVPPDTHATRIHKSDVMFKSGYSAFQTFVRNIEASTMARMRYYGETILEYAAREDDPTYLAILLNTDTYEQASSHITRAFLCACGSGRPESMRLLLNTKRVSVNFATNGFTPLMMLAISNSDAAVECASLLVAQKRVDAGVRGAGTLRNTALMLAAQHARPELFDIILGASMPYVDCFNSAGETALGISITHNNTHAEMRLLVVSNDRNVYEYAQFGSAREEWMCRTRWGFRDDTGAQRREVVRALVTVSARGFGCVSV